MKIVLASGSPRRAKILKDLGVDFAVVKTDAPEVSYPADPERTVRENALAKGAALSPRKGVLSADTIVWFANRIYGKPRDLEEAKEFLRELAGNVHTVFTGVAFDGEVKVVEDEEVERAQITNPRTAIGMVEPLHYIMVVSDGRTEESEGLSLFDLGNLMQDLGCDVAYNLDGGGSSTFWFRGEVLNKPTTFGDVIQERLISDIVYIGY